MHIIIHMKQLKGQSLYLAGIVKLAKTNHYSVDM